jgi:elongation factor P
MSSMQATRIRKGQLILHEGCLCRVVDMHHITPGNKRAHVQCKLRDIRNGRLVDHKFRAEEDVERASLDEREMQFLYRDGDMFNFMDTSNYEQVHISLEALGDQAQYLLPEALINVEFYEADPVGIHLPLTVDLKVTETAPGIKGATAAAQVKPATVQTGLVINVPSFVNEGDVVRINTETGEYLSRV